MKTSRFPEEADREPVATYLGVVVTEVLVLLALWVLGRWFTA